MVNTLREGRVRDTGISLLVANAFDQFLQDCYPRRHDIAEVEGCVREKELRIERN